MNRTVTALCKFLLEKMPGHKLVDLEMALFVSAPENCGKAMAARSR